MMTVYKLRPFGEKTHVFDDLEAALSAAEELLQEMGDGEEITIQKREMSTQEFEALPDL